MWYPVSLRIVNLFSYENSSFEFVNNQTTTIFGVNKTDANKKSNGSGKTSILDTIGISIMGEPLRDIAKKEIVRNGEKSGMVVFILKNNILNKELSITTEVNVTKSNKVLIYENGVLNTKFKDLEAKESYKYILSLIGISKEDLKNYFLISKDSYTSFFKNGDTAKKEIINRFSKANMVDPVVPLIKADIDLLEVEHKKFNDQYITNKGILTHLDEELNTEKLSSSIEQTRQLTIQALQDRHLVAKTLCDELPDKIEAQEKLITEQNNKIEEQKTILIQLEEKVKIQKEQKEVHEKELGAIQKKEWDLDEEFKPKFEEIQKQITTIRAKIKESQASIKECNEEIGQIDGILAGQIECPKCDHKFILKNKTYDIESALEQKREIEVLKKELEDSIEEAEVELVTCDTKIDTLNKQLDTAKVKYVIQKNKEKEGIKVIDSVLQQLKKDIDDQTSIISKEQTILRPLIKALGELDGKADYYIGQMNDCTSAIQKEKEKVYPDKTAEIQSKIDTLQTQNEELVKEITSVEEDIGTLKEWQVRFTQFKSFLANSSISAIEEMTNFFLQKMKTNLTVQIDGYRELSNKKLKEEITTLVTRDGLNGESFNKFSGGERAEIDIACICAMQKIINIAAEGGGLNLLFIDEILESADSLVLSGIVKALSPLEQTILIITHVDHNAFECNKLNVEKVDGISKVVSLS